MTVLPDQDPIALMRLLINDTDPNPSGQVFSDTELDAFLAIEAGALKAAAAQAIDTIADNEALVSKVIRSQDVSTDGAKVADALRKRAAELRRQVAAELDAEDGDGWFGVVPTLGHASTPELTDPRAWW